MTRLAMVRVPLRVSFVGGGSDIPPGPGRVVSCTIDKHVYVVAKRRADDAIYLTWREKEVARQPEDLKHDLVREALLEVGISSGIEILTFADVPGVGSGLGSSASTLVGLLHALFLLKGYRDKEIDRRWLARIACEIQIKRLGRRQGGQDEWACSLGGLRGIEFKEGQDACWSRKGVRTWSIRLPPPGLRHFHEQFLLFRPRDGAGRDAERILGTFQDNADFRGNCEIIADHFEKALELSDWGAARAAIREHHQLKTSAFPGYRPSELERLEEVFPRMTLKLCGAGGTGHLLASIDRRERPYAVQVLGEAWGPQLLFSFVDYGTGVVYQE